MSANETPGLDPDEPRTPWWFTLLGLGLFLFGAIFLLATEDEEVAPAAQADGAAAQADGAAAPADGAAVQGEAAKAEAAH